MTASEPITESGIFLPTRRPVARREPSYAAPAKVQCEQNAASITGSGLSVAVDGDTAVVGTVEAAGQWTASVFVRDTVGWTLEAKLFTGPMDPKGATLAIAGNLVVIGTPGIAHIFERRGRTWNAVAEVISHDLSFGSSVAVGGGLIAIGGREAVHLYERQGPMWVRQAELTAWDGKAGDRFGAAVSIEKDMVVIGAPGKGAVYVFARNGWIWGMQQVLSAADGMAGDNFGASVSLSDDTVVVGAPNHDKSRGAAYVYVSKHGDWSLASKLTIAGAEPRDSFGFSVDISGDVLVAGAPIRNDFHGVAYMFVRRDEQWVEERELTGARNAASKFFGYSVAVSGDVLAVATPFERATHVYSVRRPKLEKQLSAESSHKGLLARWWHSRRDTTVVMHQ